MSMISVNRGHLGGFIRATKEFPHGDPMTYTPQLWDWMIEHFQPKDVIDVGCGEGHSVRHFVDRGVNAFGIDGCQDAWDSPLTPRDRMFLHDYTTGRFEVPNHLRGISFDLAYSCEFVEHVEERFLENILATFELAQVIALSHGLPGQEGHHHVNCQLAEYWIGHLSRRGYRYDSIATFESRKRAPGSYWARSGLILMRDVASSV